jgi:radical SAM protein with 4Fe4S-binding SPASM domain
MPSAAPAPYYASRSSIDDAIARGAARGTPLFAHVYVENRCNLKCAHCYESEDSHPHEAHLSLDDYARIFDELAALGVLIVTLSGGEPFLRRDFLDIVELARKKRFAVRIYTSGTLLTPEKCDRLRDLKVQEVHISVYSPHADAHDRFTGIPRSHEKSVRALEMLHERGIHTVLKANVMTFNVDDIDGLIALAKAKGADWQLDPTVKPKWNGDRSPLQFAVSPALLRDKVLWRPDLQSVPSLENAAGLCDGENPRKGQNGGMCAAGTKLISVWADGQLSPCAMMPKATAPAGRSVVDVWKNDPLFRSMRGQRFDDMKQCPTCDVRSTCEPCMAYALVEHGDMTDCNSSSLQYATGRRLLAERMVRTERKARSGRELKVLDPDVDLGADAGKMRLSAEL